MTAADFLSTIIASHADDAPRLVFADWLQENGEPERAEFIRVQVELDNGQSVCPCDPSGKLPGGVDCGCRWCALRRRERELLSSTWRDFLAWELTKNKPWGYEKETLEAVFQPPDSDNRPRFRFRRGFVESITCTWSDFLAHHVAIRAATPLREVTLTTRPGLLELSRVFSKDFMRKVLKDCEAVPPGLPISETRCLQFLHAGFKGLTFHLPLVRDRHEGDALDYATFNFDPMVT